MRFAVIFDDSPHMSAVRALYEPAHIAYLKAHHTQITEAGGLREHADHPHVGGLWIVEASSRNAVERLIENDPYHIHGARPHRILLWGNAFTE